MNNPRNFSISLAGILLNLMIQPLQKINAASLAGDDSAAPIAGLFTKQAENANLQNFSANELVIETGRDIFVGVEQTLVPAVFAESSVSLQKFDKVIPAGSGTVEICTSIKTW